MDGQFNSFLSFFKFLCVSHLAGATMLGLVKSCIGTKFTSQFGNLIAVSISIIDYCLWVVIPSAPSQSSCPISSPLAKDVDSDLPLYFEKEKDIEVMRI